MGIELIVLIPVLILAILIWRGVARARRPGPGGTEANPQPKAKP
jgi:hypothetical protein